MTRARIQHQQGAPAPINAKGRNFWHMIQSDYPHSVSVDYMSEQDLDPRKVNRHITREFKRVPFDGKTHFGFAHEHHLNQFKRIVGLL